MNLLSVTTPSAILHEAPAPPVDGGVPGHARPPILLARAGYTGTLAAARCLGARGIPVWLAGAGGLDPARWSRYVRCVPVSADPERLMAWLLREAPAGLVVYASCDDLAWMLARDREALARRHLLYSPPVGALESLLDKKRLHELSVKVGLHAPATWYPRDEAEALRLVPELTFPVVLKPRTQVLLQTRFKGLCVDRGEALPAAWRAACASLRYAPCLLARIPEAAVPMVQAYHRDRANTIATVSGFVDESQRHFVARASIKLLQSPRGLGVGTGFESRPLSPRLAGAIQALCAAVGYHGVFDIEFLDGDEPLHIDFNPRFYNQMAFEAARGLPSPWLVYLGATGAHEALAAEVERARQVEAAGTSIFCSRLTVGHDLFWQVLAGTVPLAEALRWRTWYATHRRGAVDPFAAPGDPLPLVASWFAEAFGTLRHPRAFLRQRVFSKALTPDHPTGPQGLTVEALRSLAEARPLRTELDALNLASRRPSPFSALDYLEAVAAHDEHPVPGAEPLLLVAREGGRIAGWLPLRRHRGAAAGRRGGRIESFLVHDTDRPGVLARPEDETRCAQAFLRWLDEEEHWDELHLVQQAPDSPLRPPPGFRLAGRRLRLWPSNPNCTIQLRGHTLPSWFASLPKAHRHNVARLGRRLLSAGQVDLVWSDEAAALPGLLDLYLDVERRSWKAGAAAGAGRSPERVALFRQQLEAGRSARAVIHLLRLDGVPIAGHLGVWFGGELHAREIAFDEALSALGPGLMMMVLVVRAALEEGARSVNLLSRFGYYKKEWGAEVQPTETVQLFRVGSVAWGRSWLGDLRRHLDRPAMDGRPARANADRRAAPKPVASAVAEPSATPRGQAASSSADLESRLKRLDPAQLRAALPFDTGAAAAR